MLLNIGWITALLLVISPVNKKHLNTDIVAKVTVIQKTAMNASLVMIRLNHQPSTNMPRSQKNCQKTERTIWLEVA
jgi:hypothetical protein